MIGLPLWRNVGHTLGNIVGAVLLLAGVALAVVTAHGILQYETALAAHGGKVTDLGRQAQPQAGQYGHMVRVVGLPRVIEAPHDAQFNLTVDTPQLTRLVEMFQWREVRVGDSVHYEMDWVDHHVDPSTFRQPKGHPAAPRWPLEGLHLAAGRVQIGGFSLSAVLQRALPGATRVLPSMRTLPANLAASFSRHGDYLQTSAHADNPQLGDIRVSWTAVPLELMTVVARVDGDVLRPASDATDGVGYQVALGEVSLFDLFPDLPSPPVAVGLYRVLAVLLAMLGALVLMGVRRRATEVSLSSMLDDACMAAGAGAMAVGAVTAVLWLGHDPYRLAGWLVVALAGGLLVAWQVYRRRHVPPDGD